MKFYLLCTILSLSFSLQAQAPNFKIIGTVVEANSGQAVDYATVVARSKMTDEVLAGTTTENGGLFELIVPRKKVAIEVSFIGFNSVVIDEITFSMSVLI